MKKFFILLIILFFTLSSSLEVSAITLKGHVIYQNKEVKEALAHIDEAKKEAFENIQQSIDISTHQKHFKDPFHRMNQKLGSYTLGEFSRFITHFSDGSYCISYDDNPDITYYYDKKGKLEFIQYKTNKNITHKYNIEGKLDSIAITKKKVQYIFDEHKNLITFWIDSYAYNSNGIRILKRW